MATGEELKYQYKQHRCEFVAGPGITSCPVDGEGDGFKPDPGPTKDGRGSMTFILRDNGSIGQVLGRPT